MDIDEANGASAQPNASARPVEPKRAYHRRATPPTRTRAVRAPAEKLPEQDWAFDPRTGERLVQVQTDAPVKTIPRVDTRSPIRERKRKGGTLIDKFAFAAEDIPEGSSYEWKTMTVFGKNDPGYDVMMREQGWLPVDSARHPQFMPDGYKGAIVRDGMVLMERPIELTREAQAEDRRAAKLAVHTKEQQLGNAPPGTLPRDDPKGIVRPRISRSFEPGMIPD